MNAKTITGLVLAVLVLGGGTWYFTTHPGAKIPTVTMNESDSSEKMGTFADLMAKTGAWQCSVSAVQTQSSSTGTVFLSDGFIRGDFTAEVMGKSIGAHLIHAEGYAYTWSDMLPQGVKVKIALAAGTAGGQGIDPSTNVTYSCTPWSPDPSKFIIPSTVKFFEVSPTNNGVIEGRMSPPTVQ